MRLALVALCVVASAALAQKTEPLQHPDGVIYSVPQRAKFGSLIQVRMNFNDKLRASVHEM